MEYDIIDVELIDRLGDKMKLLELAITMIYDAKELTTAEPVPLNSSPFQLSENLSRSLF